MLTHKVERVQVKGINTNKLYIKVTHTTNNDTDDDDDVDEDDDDDTGVLFSVMLLISHPSVFGCTNLKGTHVKYLFR